MKHRIGTIDMKILMCKYSLIEGDVLSNSMDFIVYELKFESSSSGGCVCKMTSYYHAFGEVGINEEEVRAGKERAMVCIRLLKPISLKILIHILN